MAEEHIERLYAQLDKLTDKFDKMAEAVNNLQSSFAAHCESTDSKKSKPPYFYVIIGALLAYGGRSIDIFVQWLGVGT